MRPPLVALMITTPLHSFHPLFLSDFLFWSFLSQFRFAWANSQHLFLLSLLCTTNIKSWSRERQCWQHHYTALPFEDIFLHQVFTNCKSCNIKILAKERRQPYVGLRVPAVGQLPLAPVISLYSIGCWTSQEKVKNKRKSSLEISHANSASLTRGMYQRGGGLPQLS